jgi:copper chaperone
MKTEHVSIAGMSCHHCVMAVKKELGKLEGVTAAEVAIGSATITYDESRVERSLIDAAIQKAGYTVVQVAV